LAACSACWFPDTEPGENHAGGREAVFEMEGAGVAGVMSNSKGLNSNTLVLGDSGLAARMLEEELVWWRIDGVVPLGLEAGVVEVIVADLGRAGFPGLRVSVLSLKSSHKLAEPGLPTGISGGNAAVWGIGGSGFVVRRGGSAGATCPRTSDGCSVAVGWRAGSAGDVSFSRLYTNGFSRWVRNVAPKFDRTAALFFALSCICVPIPAWDWLTSYNLISFSKSTIKKILASLTSTVQVKNCDYVLFLFFFSLRFNYFL
jgi:hypothetical protein